MGKFRFRLATMLRLREVARDERRAQLAEAYAAEQTLNERRNQLLAESNELRRSYSRAAAPGALNVDSLLDTHRFQLMLGAHLKVIDDQAAKLAIEIEKRRQNLVVADREVRVLEKLRENWRDRHQQAEQTAEMKQIDEVAGRIGHYSNTLEGAW